MEIEQEDEGRAVQLFLAIQTQWRFASAAVVAGSGGGPVRIGLDYNVLPMAAAAHGIALDGRVLTDIAEIEHAAIKAFAEARA